VPYTKVFKEIPTATRGVEQEYGTCMLASGIWFPRITTEPQLLAEHPHCSFQGLADKPKNICEKE
jgi:hypothetical protein